MLSDRHYRRFLLKVAKSTRDRYMLDELAKVKVPTMIIWGRDDSITPPFVAEQFCDNIRSAELVFIDQCGHAPPIEQPREFARLLHTFLGDMTSNLNLCSMQAKVSNPSSGTNAQAFRHLHRRRAHRPGGCLPLACCAESLAR